MAEKLELNQLKDKAIDAIQGMACQYDLKGQLLTQTLLDKVLKKTSTKMIGLRRFTVYLLVYAYLCRGEEQPDESDEDDECDEPWFESKKRCVNSGDLNNLWRMVRNEFEFFRAFQNQLTRQILRKGKNDEPWVDPRTRDDDPEDRCFFHCHE